MKTFCVSVIECLNNLPIGLCTFDESQDGNKEAEKLFVQLIKENYPETPDEDMESYLEDGLFQKNDYSVSIFHS